MERLEAGVKLANGIIKTAHELGMTATIDVEGKLAAAAQKTYPKADWPEHSLGNAQSQSRSRRRASAILDERLTSEAQRGSRWC